jgi:hypothetical protein
MASFLRAIAKYPMAYWISLLGYLTDTNMKFFFLLTQLSIDFFFKRSVSVAEYIIYLVALKNYVVPIPSPSTPDSYSVPVSH